MGLQARARRSIAGVLAGVVLAGVVVAGAACTADSGTDGPDGTTASAGTAVESSAGGGDEAAALTRADVDAAIEAWQPRAQDMLERSGVPGMSVAIVYQDEVVFSEGFGVKELGTEDAVDADTVFQIASLSKPIATTVVADIVGDGAVDWDDPIVEYDPDFELSDPAVTEMVTFADLLSHRSGLPDHGGDLLEDLGYSRDEIIERLRLLPLVPIRTEWLYTNMGFTEAGQTAAEAAGMSWEDASQELLYGPAGMEHTSSRFDDFMAAENRAVPHAKVDGEWAAEHQRQPDAQSPAGGVSSTSNDMARWLRIQMSEGSLDGEQIADADALFHTKVPHIVSGPPAEPGDLTAMYGLGWGVGTDPGGRVVWSHSGAFLLGTGTYVSIYPNEELGIVILTNGEPVGLAESVGRTFMGLALDGESPDWFERMEPRMVAAMRPEPEVDYTTPPADAAPPRDLSVYEGTYQNDYFGPLTVRVDGESLAMTLGPEDMAFELTPYDGDTFWFMPRGENAVNPSAATFTVAEGQATEVTLEYYDEYDLGTWVR